jgi:hypothetical protein
MEFNDRLESGDLLDRNAFPVQGGTPCRGLWNNGKLTFGAKAIRRSHRVEEVAPIKNSR